MNWFLASATKWKAAYLSGEREKVRESDLLYVEGFDTYRRHQNYFTVFVLKVIVIEFNGIRPEGEWLKNIYY